MFLQPARVLETTTLSEVHVLDCNVEDVLSSWFSGMYFFVCTCNVEA